ncbi:amidohydrolase family protein [Paremcibacter congregatus]|uniref:amidohydrolase family protein n=1 Tax=Paremcibacter congregatus TaxID=2043170 RepID=UPI00111FC1D1|nr:amidohydrolase family protein [Paremcibacter congregatus]QDE26245.1 amidohydrolase [Paremcibacter congregatus]
MTDNSHKIIDFRVRLPEALRPDIEVPKENSLQYDAVLGTSDKFGASQTTEALLAQMEAAGIDHAVVHAEYEVGDPADALNQAVADLVNEYPARLSGIGTISMKDFSIKNALRQVTECAERGMIGLSIQPAFFGMTINDKLLYPIYAKAIEHNLLVALHTGVNYTMNKPMAGENPMLIDEVCCHFPDLTVVASHAGWPWIAEMVAVARKHPQVYMEFGGLSPKYVGAPGSGWEVMHRFMNSVLSQQILFGTDWPVMDHARVISEWKDLGLKPHVEQALLGGNAKRLIKKMGHPE